MLTLEAFAEAKGFTVEQLAEYGVRQGPRGVEIPYFDTDGSERPRVRLRTALAAKDGSSWSDGTAELVPYGLNRPIAWERHFVFVVEGESDCWTLWTTGKPALGLPGATNVKCLKLEHVDGAENVYVVREPGAAGARFPHRVAERLYGLGYAGHVYAIDLDEAKDPHELWVRDRTTFDAHLRAAFLARELIEPLTKKAAEAPATGMMSLSALLAKPRVKKREIVEGILPAGGILLLAAKPKVGKSVLARNLALSVVRGSMFLDRQCERGSVVYVRLDEDYGGFLDALGAMGVDAEAAQRFHLNDEMPPIDGRMSWLTSMLQRIRPSLVIVDTWMKLTNVREIKSYSEVIRANEPLDRLAREHGIAQVWVHHSKVGDSKGGDAVLGGTALFSACDTLMNLEIYPDGLRTISTTQRQGESMEETPIVMDAATQLVSIAPAKMRLRRGKIEERLIEFLSDRPEQTKAAIFEALEFRTSDVAAALVSLIERSIVEGVGAGTKGDPVLYSVRIRSAKSTVPAPETGGSGSSILQLGPRHLENRDQESGDSGLGISPDGTGHAEGSSPVVFGDHAGASRVRALRACVLACVLTGAGAGTCAPTRANSLYTNSLYTKRLNTNSQQLVQRQLAPDSRQLALAPGSQILVSPNTKYLAGGAAAADSALARDRDLGDVGRALEPDGGAA